jgi:hypothetical protein
MNTRDRRTLIAIGVALGVSLLLPNVLLLLSRPTHHTAPAPRPAAHSAVAPVMPARTTPTAVPVATPAPAAPVATALPETGPKGAGRLALAGLALILLGFELIWVLHVDPRQ